MTAPDGDLFEKREEDDLRLTLDSNGQSDSSSKKNVSKAKIERYIDLIGNEQFSIRVAATKELSALGDKAVPALLRALRGGLWYTRECAAQALGHIGALRAIEPLIFCLRDENVGVRRSAAVALSRMIEGEGLADVAEALARVDGDSRREILESIRDVSPLAGRKLDEVLGEDHEFRGKPEGQGAAEASSPQDADLSSVAAGGIRSLWQKLRRYLQPGS